MALQHLRSLQFSSSAAMTISNHLDRNDFSKTPTCSCTTYHCSDMNAPRSQIINHNNKKFRFHLDISKQPSAAPISSVLIGMGGSRAIRASDLYNTRTLCTCHSDVNETINTLDVHVNNVGNVHSIESKSSGDLQLDTLPCVNFPSNVGCKLVCGDDSNLNYTSLCLKDLNFSGKDLSGLDFTSSYLNRATLVGSNLHSVDFSGTDLEGTDFTGANLTGATFTNIISQDGADFSGANLTNAFIGGRMLMASGAAGPVNFTAADFSGASFFSESGNQVGITCNFTRADLRYVKKLFSVFPILTSIVKYANLSGRTDYEYNFVNSDLTGVNMSSVKVNKVQIVGEAGKGAQRADGANFQDIVISEGGVFTYCSIKSANFSGAHITNLSFVGSDLSGSTFTNATLHDCDFNGVNLTNVDFSGADLSGSDLFGADLTNVNWNNTTCPNGLNTDTDGPCAAMGFLCSSDTGDCSLQVPTGGLRSSTHAACTESCVQNKYLCNPDLGCDISAGGTPQTLNQCKASCVQNKYLCNPDLGTCSLNNISGTQTLADCSNNCARICDASWTAKTYCTVAGKAPSPFIANIKTHSECETACGKKGSGCCTFVGGGAGPGCYWIEASSNPVQTTAPLAEMVTKMCKIPE